jgi:hypothetical protein
MCVPIAPYSTRQVLPAASARSDPRTVGRRHCSPWCRRQAGCRSGMARRAAAVRTNRSSRRGTQPEAVYDQRGPVLMPVRPPGSRIGNRSGRQPRSSARRPGSRCGQRTAAAEPRFQRRSPVGPATVVVAAAPVARRARRTPLAQASSLLHNSSAGQRASGQMSERWEAGRGEFAGEPDRLPVPHTSASGDAEYPACVTVRAT